MKLYKQCSFALGNKRTHGWIDADAAVVGNSMTLDGESDRWTIIGVGDSTQTREKVDQGGRSNWAAVTNY